MEILSQKEDGLAYEMKISVEADAINAQLDQQLQSIGQKAKIPGFRPGKIPMTVLRQRYGKEVMDEVLWNTINKTSRDVFEKLGKQPALKPDVDIESYEEGKPLVFKMVFEVLPEIPAMEYDKITVADYTFDVPENEIDEALERFASQKTHLHTKEGKAAKGDVVKIDFLGKIDEEPFQGGAGNDFQLELGSGQFIPGFEDQLIGSKAGDEVEVKVTFPKDYHSENLAGVDAVFDVTVHSVNEKHTPEVDEKFATEAGFESLQALRDAVMQQIKADYQGMARARSKKELFDWMDENVKFEVPSKMVAMEFEGLWQQLQQAKAQGDTSLDKPEDELKTEYQKISERRVRLGIMLADLGRQQNIQVGKDELTKAVIQQAQMFPGQEQKIFEFYQKHPEHVDELRGPIIEEKAVDYILGKVKREEKKISLAELTGEEEADATESKEAKKKPAAKKADSKKSDDAKPAAKKPAAKKSTKKTGE
ncbi:MAG: trigger factor [Rickettsiales bacterium]|nr:trigger factor [Rickettsiales bacterium]|tara:strand:- start:2951 stop:4387 length:1437 start_codon:yes stop_codon:yes gene_type:complete